MCFLRSPEFGWLVRKDVRELLASRSFWLLLAGAGLLAGHAFSTAVATYSEMSGTDGGPAALRAGLNPLDGIVIPTLGVLTLIATLLLPFIVIRMIARERANGSWKLLVQGPASLTTLLLSKVLVIIAAWLAAWIPMIIALCMWRASGNHLHAPEVLSVMLGHFVFAWLTIGVAACAAALSTSESSAAIAALGFTIGTWALDFIGAARGGAAARIAAYTPTSILRSFERGLIRTDALVVMLAIGLAGLLIAAVSLNLRASVRLRVARSLGVLAVLVPVVVGASLMRGASDVSEDRRNSFSPADERALRAIPGPLHVSVHLAAEDPRLADLRINVLDKLQRLLPSMKVTYAGGAGTGMFARPGEGYGETWYEIGGRRAMTHSTAEPIVLDVLYHLSGIAPPAQSQDGYPGYPLVGHPRGVRVVFYAVWPMIVAALYSLSRMRRNTNQD
jgi:ABC-type transport system involved in multi-copper enzyme maturation permease subunit